jgi:hypothetical protein
VFAIGLFPKVNIRCNFLPVGKYDPEIGPSRQFVSYSSDV